MNLTGVVFVISFVLSTSYAGWLQKTKTSRGLYLGNGFSIRFDNTLRENASFFDRLALRFDDAGYGVSVGRDQRTNGIHVGFYKKDENKVRGRGHDDDGEDGEGSDGGGGKKVGDVVIPTLMGFKMASITTMALFGISLFVVKVLGLAKLAFLVSGTLLLARFLQKPEQTVEILPPPEFEHQPSEGQQFYTDYHGLPDAAAYNNPSAAAAANYYAYANYAPPTGQENSAAESVSNFAIVESPNNNVSNSSSNSQQQGEGISKRRDYVRRKLRIYPSQKKLKKYILQV